MTHSPNREVTPYYGFSRTFGGHSDMYGRDHDLAIDGVGEGLSKLVDHLQTYDDLRVRLEAKGGAVSDLEQLTELLVSKVEINGPHSAQQAKLSDPGPLLLKLRTCFFGRVNLDIRQLTSGFPVYYLSRDEIDYRSGLRIIVDDLYISPGYPMPDPRFPRLLDIAGRDAGRMRLSPFRDQVCTHFSGDPDSSISWRTDRFLCSLADLVFQAAWDIDQQMAFSLSKKLGLDSFREAIELIHLCLGGDLCQLRSNIDQNLRWFFEKTYPHDAISRLMEGLPRMNGLDIDHLPQIAQRLYPDLTSIFSKLIQTKIPWSPAGANIPLYKLLFANVDRFEVIIPTPEACPELAKARRHITEFSKTCIEELTRRSL